MPNVIPPRIKAPPPQGGTGGKITNETPAPKLKIDPKPRPRDDEFIGPIGKGEPDENEVVGPKKR